MESVKLSNGAVTFYYPDRKNSKYFITSYIERVRKERNLTQSQLSELCGLSANTISSYENGIFCPTLVHAFRICDALDDIYDFHELFDYRVI